MPEKHLAEPLDYLYEELSPAGMAEARRHLAECAECRARVREIRETVKRYREAPRPAAPEGLVARAAEAALREKNSPKNIPEDEPKSRGESAAHAEAAHAAPRPEPVLELPVLEPSENRQARLEADFERLKREVRDEMRKGWRQWFFHPAWTIAASALLVSSLAIHFSPRSRNDGAPARRGYAVPAQTGPARDLRNRERIPAPHPRAAAEPPHGEAPVALLQANARRDLPLASPAPGEDAAAAVPVAPAAPGEVVPLLAPDELAALVAAPADGGGGATVDLTDIIEMDPPQLIARPRGFDRAERVRTLTSLAAMQIAKGELPDAAQTVAMLGRYDAGAAGELSALLAEAEKTARAQTPEVAPETVPEPEAKPEAASEPEPGPEPAEEPVRVRLVEQPKEREAVISDPEPVIPDPAIPEAPEATPEPAPEPAPAPRPEPARVELKVYITPAPASGAQTSIVSEPLFDAEPVREPELRGALDPSRAAELARVLSQSVVETEQAPARERERFTTDPYLRDD